MVEADTGAMQVAGVGAEQGAGQPEASPGETIFSTIKSIAVRAMMFYFIMSFFKGKQQPAPGAGEAGGVAKPMRGPATNLYSEGMGFDLYVYLSEQENDFAEFDVSSSVQKHNFKTHSSRHLT